MKKLFLFIAISYLATALPAQQIYNGSFTQWSNFTNPDGWGTWATAVGAFNSVVGDSLARLAVRDTLPGDYTVDSAALKMVVDTITLPAQGQVTLPGFVSLGGAFYNSPPDTPYGLHFGYYPYGQKPDSLIFDYKFIPAAGFYDSALVVMTMERFDSAIQQEVYYINESWLLDTTSSWVHVALKLAYLDSIGGDTFTLPPDSIQIIIISSVANPLHLGTALWVDTIHFDASIDIRDTLGVENISGLQGVKAYPNPANELLHIAVQPNMVGSGIRLYDASGRRVYDAVIDQALYPIDSRDLPPGAYSIEVNSTDRLTVYHGRITVVHGSQ